MLDVERLVARVEDELQARAESERAQPMADYMKTEDPFFGVQAKPRREVFRDIAAEFAPADAEEYDAIVRGLYAQPHRETRYVALDYAMKFKRFIKLEALPLYEHLVRDGAWWDLVDGVATHLVGGVLRDHREEVAPLMCEWVEDEDMWIRRTAIICQNRHRAETDSEMLFDFCTRRMAEKEFFIRKAIGWALREYSYAEPDAVLSFLERHRPQLSGLSYREGAKRLRREGLME